MASDLQKKKLMHLFNTFYDYNHDGVIEWVDFEACVDRICGIHGWDKAGDQAKKITDTLKIVWAGLQKYADKNKDMQIEPAEWFQMWDECLQSKGSLPEWNNSYCNFFFDISDTSGDNIVDLEEYEKVYTQFGCSAQECKESFNKFSTGGEGITREAFAALWNEYILSSDANAKGNHLFGPIRG